MRYAEFRFDLRASPLLAASASGQSRHVTVGQNSGQDCRISVQRVSLRRQGSLDLPLVSLEAPLQWAYFLV